MGIFAGAKEADTVDLPALRLARLPDVASATLPASYERAKTALMACDQLDECQAWADKAEALASYAKQSGDTTMRKMADRIQARAIRRCGELLKQIMPATGAHLKKAGAGPLRYEPSTSPPVATWMMGSPSSLTLVW